MTILAGADFLNNSISMWVRRKGPKWLVAIVISIPSTLFCLSKVDAYPAFWMKTSILLSLAFKSSAKSRIDLKELKSSFLTMTFSLPDSLIIWSATKRWKRDRGVTNLLIMQAVVNYKFVVTILLSIRWECVIY